MNIDEYRAMVEAEKQEPQQEAPQESAVVDSAPQTEPETTEATETQTEPETTETATPQYVEVDGKQIPIDELTKGYMMQSDYTRKTQELAREKKRLEEAQRLYDMVQKDPQLTQELRQKGAPILNPMEAQLREVNEKYQDLLLEREIDSLKAKYEDFDPRTVLQFAYDNKFENLEDAYLLNKARTGKLQTPEVEPVDVNKIKEEIRQELLKELQSNVDTGSIIRPGGDKRVVKDDTPQLSAKEEKVARMMRMTPQEYAKWRNKK